MAIFLTDFAFKYYIMILTTLLTTTVALTQTPDRPNIIVFLVDDMGLMDTSVPFIPNNKGVLEAQPLNSWYHTPNMEVLSERGIRFSNFYAQSVSSPSRTSMLTGQNATRHRTTNWINAENKNSSEYGPKDWNWAGLTKSDVLYPSLLKDAGYKTIHIGKAHFGPLGSIGVDPLNLGFDVNIGGNSNGHPGSYYGEEGYGNIKGQKARAVPHLEKYHNQPIFLSEALTLEANKEIETAIEENKPFYLNMCHYAVHTPFQSDPRFAAKYKDATMSKDAQAFATLIEGMDKSLGDILVKLDELGVAENTIIFFLGDNGGDAPLGGPEDYGSSAPLKGKKGSAYEGGVRVPFIASWAKVNPKNKFQKRYPISSGSVQNQMATIMDIFPSVLSVAGLKLPQKAVIDGANLKKMLAGKQDRKHNDYFLMHFPHEHRSSYFTTFRKGDWKLMYFYNPETPTQPSVKLFNLKIDPYEYNDVAMDNLELLQKLYNEMELRLIEEGALYPVDKDGNEIRPNLGLIL